MNRFSIIAIALIAIASATAQRQPPTPAQGINANFTGLNKRILDMAQDFPADKYDYRPAAGLRSFGDVILHVASGNIFGARAGKGEQVKWDDMELDPKNFKGKADIVAALQKSITDATETLKAIPAEQFTKTLYPWLAIIEHAGEHYGQLVVYYRNNGLVPPESRK